MNRGKGRLMFSCIYLKFSRYTYLSWQGYVCHGMRVAVRAISQEVLSFRQNGLATLNSKRVRCLELAVLEYKS